MKNIQYFTAEGTETYQASLAYPINSKQSAAAKAIISELKSSIKVGERRNLDRGETKWNVTIDEFSVMYLGTGG